MRGGPPTLPRPPLSRRAGGTPWHTTHTQTYRSSQCRAVLTIIRILWHDAAIIHHSPSFIHSLSRGGGGGGGGAISQAGVPVLGEDFEGVVWLAGGHSGAHSSAGQAEDPRRRLVALRSAESAVSHRQTSRPSSSSDASSAPWCRSNQRTMDHAIQQCTARGREGAARRKYL